MKFSMILSALALVFSTSALAQTKPFSGEAEAGAMVVSGTTDSDSYNAKAKAGYQVEKNVYSAFGRYLKASTQNVESARSWEAGVRYERELTDYFSLYLGQKAESDVFNGYVQRDSSDFGAKYFLTKNDVTTWFAELGYRYQTLIPTAGSTNSTASMARLYTEVSHKASETLSFKYWAEYLPNFTDSNAYLANTELSLNAMLNSTFSLKLGYLLQYQNAPTTAKRTTTTSTVNLVAKF